MNTKEAYNHWADQYDTNHNRTRDLEALSLRETLADTDFQSCLEIGCGTGKNTVWLIEKTTAITAVDLSDKMLEKAKQKIQSPRVSFIQADITQPWCFVTQLYELVTFSLVLEHIHNLEPVLHNAAISLAPGGHLYIGELHPFKQYTGTKARFDTANGQQVVPCFNHHMCDFYAAAQSAGLELVNMNEYFDDNDRSGVPRILSLLFQKK